MLRIAKDGARDAVFAVPEDRIAQTKTGQPVQLSDSQVPVRAAEVQAITTGVAASIVEAHDLPQQNTHESPAGSQ